MERKRSKTTREPDRVRHDIGIPELANKHEYEILQLGIIIGTEEGIKAIKMTTASTLKFIDKIKKEMEEDDNK